MRYVDVRTGALCVAWLLAAVVLQPGRLWAQEHASNTFCFGVLPQRSAVLTAMYWNPILAYVQRKTGLTLKLKVSRTGEDFNAAIASGKFDFIYSNTMFRPSLATAGYRCILAPRVDSVRGVVAVPENSPYVKLEDLQGKTVGFPSCAAFVGYAVTKDQLVRRGIEVNEVFCGNQEGTIAHLASGALGAVSVNSQLLKAYAERTGLKYRVLWQSTAFANLPVAVHPRVPQDVVLSVRQAVAGMHDDPRRGRGAHRMFRGSGPCPTFRLPGCPARRLPGVYRLLPRHRP